MATMLDQPTETDARRRMIADEQERRRVVAEELVRQKLAGGQLDLDRNEQVLAKGRSESTGAVIDADAAQWAATPYYKDKDVLATEEGKQHFLGGAYPGMEHRAAQAVRQQQAQTGTIPGVNLPLVGASVGPGGEVTRQFESPKAQPVTGIVTEKDVADAGIDPRSVPQNEWASAVAKAKLGREGKMTEMQSNALQYSSRMAYNRSILDKLESEGFDPSTAMNAAQSSGPNIIRNPQVQAYNAARDNWITAVLRKESGAAISQSEYKAAYRQYFPQWGDAPEVMKQKAELRKMAEHNMKLVAGGRAAEADLGGAPPAGEKPAPTTAAPVQVNSQQEYDSLPSGTVYTDSNGKRATKR